jgi:hypothetical protein
MLGHERALFPEVSQAPYRMHGLGHIGRSGAVDDEDKRTALRALRRRGSSDNKALPQRLDWRLRKTAQRSVPWLAATRSVVVRVR